VEQAFQKMEQAVPENEMNYSAFYKGFILLLLLHPSLSPVTNTQQPSFTLSTDNLSTKFKYQNCQTTPRAAKPPVKTLFEFVSFVIWICLGFRI